MIDLQANGLLLVKDNPNDVFLIRRAFRRASLTMFVGVVISR
ncbi:MAG: hypothetical protein WA901_08150 [Phormidesmis sp.]